MQYLTPEFLKELNRDIIQKTGGIRGSVNEANLHHACVKLEMNKGDVVKKAAHFLHFMAFEAHAFTDGNKRTAFIGCEAFLAANGWVLDVTEQETIGTVLLVASGNFSLKETENWLRSKTRLREKTK